MAAAKTKLTYNPRMWSWLVENKQWVFSGAGLTVIATIVWFIRKLSTKRQPVRPAVSVNTTQSSNITVSPVINLHERTEPPRQEVPVTPPVARANLRIEAIKLAKIYLRGDIWTVGLPRPSRPAGENNEVPFMGLFADVANVPTSAGNIKTIKLKAALTIQSRGYSPLPWIDEYINTVRLEPAARKSVLLTVGHVRPLGSWHFVLNHRDEYFTPNEPSRMDWTNMAPIPSDLPLEIMLVDVDSGELVAKFEYVWTFDSTSNRPFLKAPNLA